MADDVAESVEDIERNLEEYKEQLGEVNEALEADPGDEECLALKEELQGLIQLTEELLRDAKAAKEIGKGGQDAERNDQVWGVRWVD